MKRRSDAYYSSDVNDLLWRKVPYFPGMSFLKSGELNDAFRELDKWTLMDKSIRKYISKTPLGLYLAELSDMRNLDECCPTLEIFFAYKNVKKIFSKEKIELVGVCAIDTSNAYTAYLQYLAVNPKYRKCGIGSQMIESVLGDLSFFTKYSYSTKVVAVVDKANKPMAKLLDKFFDDYDAPRADCEVKGDFKRVVAFPENEKEISE